MDTLHKTLDILLEFGGIALVFIGMAILYFAVGWTIDFLSEIRRRHRLEKANARIGLVADSDSDTDFDADSKSHSD